MVDSSYSHMSIGDHGLCAMGSPHSELHVDVQTCYVQLKHSTW